MPTELLPMERLFYFIVATVLLQVVDSTTFTFKNNCPFTVWPATLQGSSSRPLSQTGFQLDTAASTSLAAPPAWTGRMWARTGCAVDAASGNFSCQTGDCGTGLVACGGSRGTGPATLVEFAIRGHEGEDVYDASLVEGFNVPVSVTAEGGSGECTGTGCPVDVNVECPGELQVRAGGEVVGCRSACDAFGTDRHCCRGAYGGPRTCKPSGYSQIFKSACPLAYSYPYDDDTVTFTCTGANYHITYCP